MSRRPGVAGKGRTRQAIQFREVREGPAGQGSAGCKGKDRAVSSRQDRAGWGKQARQAGRRGQFKAGQGRAGQAGQAVNLGYAGREGQVRQSRQAGKDRKCRTRKLRKAGQSR